MAFLSFTFEKKFVQSSTIYLTLSQTSPCFSRVCSISLLLTLWEKEKLLITSNFSFSHSVFYPFGELSFIFIEFEIDVCKLFQFGKEITFEDKSLTWVSTCICRCLFSGKYYRLLHLYGNILC